jgi:CHAD domain-containing protein
VRKRYKKVRALLKLARTGLGDRTYRRENARYRAAGKPLTEVRDAEVLAEVFDDLTERFAGDLDADTVLRIRSVLRTRRDETRRRVLEDAALLRAMAESVGDGRRQAGKRPFRRRGLSLLADGLGRAYDRARRAFEVAMADSRTENLHEWRKRVKDLLYQLRFLIGARSGAWDDRIERTDELATVLGDDHDRAVLDDFLRQHGLPADAVAPLIGRRRDELLARARDLGRVVHGEESAEFVRRFRADWKRSRSGRAAAVREAAAES